MVKHVDGLTGLLNRKALEAFLSEKISSDDAVSLALLDVDHFMEINEMLGSEAGDRVLITLTELLKESSPNHHPFRVSGDEFAVVLPGTTLEQAFLQMEKLRGVVESSSERFQLPDAGTHKVTITIGVAQYPRDGKSEATLNRAASAALMSAKEIGRNQVALPPNEEMVMKSCYYPSTSTRKLKQLAEQTKKKESTLLREALEDLLRKHDRIN